MQTSRDVFTSARGMRVAIDLAGLAIAGGLFIVPAFSAVQAWAGADRRARVVAAVNVLNAAFMTVAGIGVALVQEVGATPSDAVPCDRRRQPRGHDRDRTHHAEQHRCAISCPSCCASSIASKCTASRMSPRPARTRSSRSTT